MCLYKLIRSTLDERVKKTDAIITAVLYTTHFITIKIKGEGEEGRVGHRLPQSPDKKP